MPDTSETIVGVDYVLTLRHEEGGDLFGSSKGYTVDLRVDPIDKGGSITGSHYEEGYIFDRYWQALHKYDELYAEYDKKEGELQPSNEVTDEKLAETNDRGEIIEDSGGFYTNQHYWDCDCSKNYIHKKALKLSCSYCGADNRGVGEDDYPDSREKEVSKLFN